MSRPARVVPCTRVRSTLLVGSLHALRLRGHGDAYDGYAGKRLLDALTSIGSPVWLPIDLAEAHYSACDQLGLGTDEILAVGAVVAPTAASGVRVLLRTARTTGVTPWAALENMPRYWARMYEGSAIRAVVQGPKDALIVVEGNALTRFTYWRTGLRGIIGELARALSTRSYVHELPDKTGHGVAYSLAWV